MNQPLALISRARPLSLAAFAAVLMVLAGAWAMQWRHYREIQQQAVQECRGKLSGARTHGDSLVGLNWIPPTQMSSNPANCRYVLLIWGKAR
jgi:hypothetical protein